LHEHVRTRLARYKAPKRLAFEADLPRLPNGKLEKHRLRQDYRARVERGFAPREFSVVLKRQGETP
jgi:acyl-CoA synthetase (AMP-forming)/AMP-acid ligase II